MKFTTPVSIESKEPKIDHHSQIFLVGSCFVENIGDKFDYFKLPNKRNPLGILYHPFAIRNFISRVVTGSTFCDEDVFLNNERWQSFEAHSSLSDPDRENLLSTLNNELEQTRDYIKKATHIIITPGTSWIYRQVKNNEPVANCHKLPQKNFHKEISKVKDLEDAIENIVAQIRTLNPSAMIIFTISPVRHIKDGLVENQLSKSLLFVALQNSLSHKKNIAYFPSYEILIDELRDYRFYAEDMLHPSQVATDYIWDRFLEVWFAPEAKPALKEIGNIQRSLAHRPFHENSAGHQKFLSDLQGKIEKIKKQYPHLNF